MNRFEELCKSNPFVNSIYVEACKKRKPGFCRVAFWYGLPNATGCIGLAEQIRQQKLTSEEYERTVSNCHDALPACDHDGECRWELPADPTSREREFSKIAFYPLLPALRRAGSK
jgi:hypothetical protein